ncbi:MAG: hypothetical protein J6Z14_05840 [Prevotella sp.]|nr:hypothetical protein [Prevotella sp.]
MNVKFKMPKFGRKLTGGGMVKELLLTTLATTISIVLTFGTAQYFEDRQTEKARRMIAMTIINDIDQSIEVVKKRKDAEEKGHEAACYVIENEDRLDSIGVDTLMMFVNYVTNASFDADMEFKTMNENIFNSSQDTWRTINDRKFLNNVQEFYNLRFSLEQQSKDLIIFKKPLTVEEEYEMFMAVKVEDAAAICRWLLKNKRLKNYLDLVSSRMSAYLVFLRLTTNLNEENKFLMNITEQDMEEFVNHTYMEIHPAKEKDLMGTWNAVLVDDKNETFYNLLPDHTFTTRQSVRWGTAFFRHRMVQRFSLSGTWDVEGDSLVMHYDMKSYKLEIDDSEVTYPADMAANVQWFKEGLASEEMKPILVKKLDQNSRRALATNIDKSGTRLELTDDKKETIHYQKEINK